MGKMAFFPAYFSYLNTLEGLTDAQVGRVFRAALQYAEDGTITDLDPVESLGFRFIREDIDRAKTKYDERCEKNRENIQKRWGADEHDDESDASASGNDISSNTDEYDGIRTNTNGYETYQSKSKRKRKSNSNRERDTAAKAAVTRARDTEVQEKVFKPPTVEEVRAYCKEGGYTTVSPEGFVDYYESNGWMVGNKSMKDWKASVRSWARRDKERGITTNKPSNTSFDTDEFFNAALERTYGYAVNLNVQDDERTESDKPEWLNEEE